jgi:hypothetical protein
MLSYAKQMKSVANLSFLQLLKGPGTTLWQEQQAHFRSLLS